MGVTGPCMVAALHLDCQWRVAGPAEASRGLPVAPPMANLPSMMHRTMAKQAVKLQYCWSRSNKDEDYRHSLRGLSTHHLLRMRCRRGSRSTLAVLMGLLIMGTDRWRQIRGAQTRQSI